MSKLYIIMPVINCLDLTEAAFNSIRTKYPWSFILIDQDSNDDTNRWGGEMVHKVMTEDKERGLQEFIYLRNSPKIALAAAWNQGIKKAFEDSECKWVLVPNNDILFHPKTIDHLIAFMEKTGYLMVTADNVKDKMSPEVMMQMELPMEFTDFDTWEIKDWRSEGPDFSCFMINRDTIEVLGWFDENFHGAYCEDQDYHARLNRAWRHISEHKDKGIDPGRVHAKRLSTAPYYHYASQTLVKNIPLRHDIAIQHGKNHDYYVRKWGGEHGAVMDGAGNMQPFGDASKNWKDW